MGMTQAEIQLLIRARNEAQGTLDGLNKQLGVVRQESTQAGQGMATLGEQTKSAGVQAGAAGVAFGLLADRALRAVVAAFGDSLRAANSLDAGLIGLGATAKAFNTDAGAAQAAAKALAADGLMPVGDAARGLKNLLAAGFGLDQAVVLMNRFKDSAAFGRQGALSLGEAVASATEGIKNGNSILVDNAGVTKNLSQMLTEAGFSAQDLSKASSDVNVRMALFNGIVKETNPQVGQAAIYLDTAAGKQAKFGAEVTTTQQKIGKELQPAIGNLLSALTPLVRVIGDNASAVVKFGQFMGLVLGPLVAVKAAAMLGIPSLTGLGAAWTTTGAQAAVAGTQIQVAGIQTQAAAVKLYGASGQILTTADGLQGVATGAKAAAGGMGIAAQAGIVLGTAFASWQLGKLIGEWTGLTKAIEDAAGAAGRARSSALGHANAQELLAKATQIAGREIRNVAEAEKIVTAQESIRRGSLEKTTSARLKQVDAELFLGRITQEQANSQKLLIQQEGQADEVRKRRIGLTEVLAAKEKAFADEVKATGYTQKELTDILKKDENGFNAWAKQVGLSDDTIKRLKDSLTAGTKAHTELEAAQRKAEAAAKALADAQQKTREELEKFGILTQDQVNHNLDELRQKMWAAQAAGVPLQAISIGLGGAFMDLAIAADRAGVSSAAVRAEWEALTKDADTGLPPAREFYRVLDGIGTLKTNKTIADIRVEVDATTTATEKATAAFEAFGLQSPKALQDAADAARKNYQALEDSGLATTKQLKDAYQQMIDAQKAATGQLPGLWQTEVLPAVKGTIEQMRTAIDGSFAQMLLGAKGFKDGFLDIWASLKKGVENILAQLLQSFMDNFLKQMLGAMTGQQGSFAGAFTGLFKGGGGGGLGGLFGGGGGGAASSPYADLWGTAGDMFEGPEQVPGGFVGPMQGAGALGKMARFGGGGMMALGGVMQWMQGGTKNRIMGGAQTGAGIGTMIAPGVGTLIGAGAGALAGWVSSMFGPSGKEKDGREAARAAEAEIVKGLTEQQTAEAGGEKWKQVAIAVRDSFKETGKGSDAEALALVQQLWDAEKEGPEEVAKVYEKINLVMEEARKKRQAAAEAGKQADAEQEARLTALKDKMKGLEGTYQQLLDSVKDEAPEPDMGLAEKAIRDQAADIKAQMEDVKRQIEEQMKAGADAGAEATEDSSQRSQDAFEETGTAAERLRKKMDLELGGARYVVDVEYNYFRDPNAGGTPVRLPDPDIPGAAAGIYASGARGVATWFGEGGEPEVGGPASFFERIFTKLGVTAGAGGRRGGGDLNLVLHINGVLADTDLVRTIHEKVVPVLHDAWRDNTNSARTTAREALGVGA